MVARQAGADRSSIAAGRAANGVVFEGEIVTRGAEPDLWGIKELRRAKRRFGTLQ